jgi:hypothetical protein
LTQNEISNAWYNRSEIRKIKLALDQDIQLINKGGKLDSFTIRGLEDRLLVSRARISSNKLKLNAVISVLDEQDRQIFQGNKNPNSIRNVYIRFSRHSQSEANKVAKADAREVQSIYRGEMMLSSSLSVFHKHEKIRMRKELLFNRLFAMRKLSHTKCTKQTYKL